MIKRSEDEVWEERERERERGEVEEEEGGRSSQDRKRGRSDDSASLDVQIFETRAGCRINAQNSTSSPSIDSVHF